MGLGRPSIGSALLGNLSLPAGRVSMGPALLAPPGASIPHSASLDSITDSPESSATDNALAGVTQRLAWRASTIPNANRSGSNVDLSDMIPAQVDEEN